MTKKHSKNNYSDNAMKTEILHQLEISNLLEQLKNN